jgi:hypothetical protein
VKTHALIAALALCRAAIAPAQDLPQRAPGGPAADFPPKLMLDGKLPNPASAPAPDAPDAPASPDDLVRQRQDALRLAERRAVDSEQLYKDGILAKVEAEARVMRVVEARKDLADAELAAAQARADAVKKSFAAHQAAQSDVEAAGKAADGARQAVAVAGRDWAAAQLDAAELDLKRKRKLFGEGVATRHEVEQAEDRVAFLTGTTPKQ